MRGLKQCKLKIKKKIDNYAYNGNLEVCNTSGLFILSKSNVKSSLTNNNLEFVHVQRCDLDIFINLGKFNKKSVTFDKLKETYNIKANFFWVKSL